MKQGSHTKAELEGILLRILPPIVPRQEIRLYLGDLFSRAYLANLNCVGLGPRAVKFGRKVAYVREDLISWLLDRMASEKGANADE